MAVNWFDRAIASVAPRAAARRVLARQAFETLARGYEGDVDAAHADAWIAHHARYAVVCVVVRAGRQLHDERARRATGNT